LEEEATMAPSNEPATNERIVRRLEEINAQLADASKRQEQMAHDLTRLLKHT
jgi:predicted transcriptional regulator